MKKKIINVKFTEIQTFWKGVWSEKKEHHKDADG